MTGTGCMSTAMTGCFLAVAPPLEAATARLSRSASRERMRPWGARPWLVPRRPLRRARRARPGHARRPRAGHARVKLHAIVHDLETAELAVAGGATVLQLRLKDARRPRSSRRAARSARCPRPSSSTTTSTRRSSSAPTACTSAARTQGAERALAAGLLLGLSASSVAEAVDAAGRGAAYIGAGPVWATPSKDRRRPADRARRARRDLRRRLRACRRDRRRRRVERRRLHPRRRRRRRGHARRR